MIRQKSLSTCSAFALVALVLGVSAPVRAQFAADYAAAGAGFDTLNSASTGPSNFNAINQAQNTVNNVNAGQFGGNPFGDPSMGGGNPFGDPGAGGFAAQGGSPFGAAPGGPFGASPFGQPGSPFGQPGGQPQFNLKPPTLRAWGGERIVDHVTKQVLQDARELQILSTATGSYFDDGQTGNDAVAGDNIYTNITINDNYLSPEAHVIKSKLIRTLMFVSPPPSDEVGERNIDQQVTQDLQGVNAQKDPELRRYIMAPRKSMTMESYSNLTPMEFAQVRIATTEPLNPLPKITDLERDQDEKLRDWATRFLRDFRVNPDDISSEFYPTFVPPPPRAPNIPLPITFSPNILRDAQGNPIAAQGGAAAPSGPVYAGGPNDPFAGDASGEPIGNASSRYF